MTHAINRTDETMCQNVLASYVMKLIEADLVYAEMDVTNQEFGLKMLVSLCKRYEKLLGIRYTLQTCVWYNLTGIENFFGEVCVDLKLSVDTQTAPVRGRNLTNKPAADASKTDKVQQDNTTVDDYIVKTSKDFDETEHAADASEPEVVEDDELKKETFQSEICTNEIDSDNSETVSERFDNSEEIVQDMNDRNCDSNDGINDHTHELNNNSPVNYCVRKDWAGPSGEAEKPIAESNVRCDEVDLGSDDKAWEESNYCISDDYSEKCESVLSNNDRVMHMNRIRKQKHPQRKVSPFKITLKKKVGKRKGIVHQTSTASRISDTHQSMHCESTVELNADKPTSININNRSKSSLTDTIKETPRQDNDTGTTTSRNDHESKTMLGKSGTEKEFKFLRLSKSRKKARLLQALEINPKKVSYVVKRSSRIKLSMAKENPPANQEILQDEKLKKAGTGKTKLSKNNFSYGTSSEKLTEAEEINNSSVSTSHIDLKESSDSIGKLAVRETGMEPLTNIVRFEHHGNLKCCICEKVFTRRRILHRHYRTHPEGKFACLKCGAFNKHLDELQSHMEYHYRLARYKCESCRTSFDGKLQFDTHMVGHQANTCSLCHTSLATREQLVRHTRDVHGTKAIDTHVTSSTESFACRVCSRKFKKKSLLNAHLIVHKGELRFECSVCQLLFGSKKALGRHKRTNSHCVKAGSQPVEKKFLCQDCGKAYFKKHALQRHMRFHRGEKQQECQYCDFRCQEANNLKRHIALHFESQRNFVCEICGAAFHAKKTLEVHHVYKHSTERKFECSQCFQSFKDKSAMKRHEKVHNLEKEHKCVCGMAFRRVCNLRRHMRLVHGGDENYLPPVKHVSTLDNRKKKPVSKTDFACQVKDTYESGSLYEDTHDASVDSGTCMSRPAYVTHDTSIDSSMSRPAYVTHDTSIDSSMSRPAYVTHDTSIDSSMSRPAYVTHDTSIDSSISRPAYVTQDTSIDSSISRPAYITDDVSEASARLYKVSLLRPSVGESTDQIEATNPNISDDSTATMSDYSQQGVDTHTATESGHKPEDPHDTSINHDVSQQISNREMFVGNFCFPHLAMATNSVYEPQTAVLPHIHMLQNPQLKDSLQMPLPKPPPQKFTFTFGNHWQKFIHNELDFGYRDPEHSFRFPSTHLDNSVLLHQRLVNQDPREALQDPRNALHDPREAIHDPRNALQDPRQASHDPRDALQDHREALDPREALHDPREALHDPREALHDPRDVLHDPREASHEHRDTLHDPREALHGSREALHDPREAFQDPRESLHDPRESLHDPRDALHDPRDALHDPRDALHGDMTLRMQQDDLGQKTLHEGTPAEQNLVREKLVSETGYASPYHASYSHQSSYEPAIGSKATMSEMEQAEENAYFQSRREMAAESLAQMAALAMDASFQQQTEAMKSQLL